ncbi:carbamoyltransferase HypF [Clostridium sp. YIM B02515]|uniref:Carbamoyltransferase n=1 Tax=Clostridium rhizosphaerae TaxID=2803861 RepID=A0ABS1T7G2_9CLOT|nr:carbamoyltransferase HypF [Clostridium rhizosphaerae]MBL4935274.1 carbamoyltransferase HypF [Clostridium rhizosphaerae]
MNLRRVFIKVLGIVQGVGFRPFVYNLAASLNLKGWVNNNSEGVYIDLEGQSYDIDKFLTELKDNPPPLSRIENIITEEMTPADYAAFTIKESERDESNITLISPDMATCEECRKDILNPNNRRYGYPFTNCTNCGPRFSIIKSIPYDRDKTTMKKFKMCCLCMSEYKDPSNRRFHAQPNACDDCGPHIWITDANGSELNINYESSIPRSLNTLKWAVKKLKEGKIFAIKGLTGFHLCCDAYNEEAVKLLRERKHRPHKPFAVMAKNLDIVKKYCHVNTREESLLTGIKKPIVLLNQKQDFSLTEAIAPNQNTLGVMLPYTPLHELLFNEGMDIMIMTSANFYSLPLEFNNDSAIKNLSSIVDYFLFHNRDIYIPVDDSVVKVINDEEMIIRRARGYAPDPFKYEDIEEILACGPNMKNTFSIGKENFIFMSQHNGDLENLETIEHYSRNIEHLKNIFSFHPKYLAFDLHPDYASTIYSEDYVTPKIGIQHHHAHIASCLAENKIKSKVIGIAFDGTGYGTDGTLWGGEFFICDTLDFKRLAHLDYIKMPGGEMAIKEPWRMGASYVHEAYKRIPNNEFKKNYELNALIKILFADKGLNLIKILESSLNNIKTSSMGRLFDAVSSIIGINQAVTYEGQASIELENIINKTVTGYYPFNIVYEDESYIIEPYETILSIIKDKINNVESSEISAKFHNTIVEITYNICSLIRNKTNINEVALSGGVFQNSYLLVNVVKRLKEDGFAVYTNKSIPINDGGISFGQIVIANERLKHNL